MRTCLEAGGLILRSEADQCVRLSIFDRVDQTVDILRQKLCITYQRGRAPIIAALNCLARLMLELPRVVCQLSDKGGTAVAGGPLRFV
jgi:hypothetical protein